MTDRYPALCNLEPADPPDFDPTRVFVSGDEAGRYVVLGQVDADGRVWLLSEFREGDE